MSVANLRPKTNCGADLDVNFGVEFVVKFGAKFGAEFGAKFGAEFGADFGATLASRLFFRIGGVWRGEASQGNLRGGSGRALPP